MLICGGTIAFAWLVACDRAAIAPPTQPPMRSGPCTALDAEACFASAECAGRYGPSAVSANIATTDVAFLACVSISPAELERTRAARVACETAGNRWQRTPQREPGFCACADVVAGSGLTECPP